MLRVVIVIIGLIIWGVCAACGKPKAKSKANSDKWYREQLAARERERLAQERARANRRRPAQPPVDTVNRRNLTNVNNFIRPEVETKKTDISANEKFFLED